MIFRQLFDHKSSTYTYLIACEKSREALLIDPVVEKVPLYMRMLKELDLKLVKAADTHLHADHITALGSLRELTDCVTVMGRQSRAECVSATVGDGDVLEIGELSVDVLYTPGHTDDSYTYKVGNKLLTGDTLFIRGTGRTDFQNGDSARQYDAIFGRLLKFPDDTEIWPGHDYNGFTMSTIGEEKRWNPRLQVQSKEEYIALMGSLNLPNPQLIDVAVPANMSCGVPQNSTEDYAKSPVPAITVAELAGRLKSDPKLLLVDVRTPHEFESVHVQEARNLSLASLTTESFRETFGDVGQKDVYLICRSEKAGRILQDAGYSVINIMGGTESWVYLGLPVVKGVALG